MINTSWDTVILNPNGAPKKWAILPEISEAIVKDTPGLLNADTTFAKQMGGEFVAWAVNYVENVIQPKYPLIVDTKIHMLKDGWIPGIPGWHLDFAPNWKGIVDFEQIDEHERHFMAITSGISSTEFLKEPLPVSLPRIPKINGLLSRLAAAYNDTLETTRVEPCTLYEFGQLDLHRACPATDSGWRLFVRISATILRKPRNEIRQHDSQIYIVDEHGGW